MKIEGRKSYKAGSGKNECASPPYAVVPLEKLLQDGANHLKRRLVVWEPATGVNGQHTGLVEGLRLLGCVVYETPGIDFLTYIPDFEFDMIITNPPYDVGTKRRFIRRCDYWNANFSKPWALLMSTPTMGDKLIRNILSKCSIIVPNGRICFGMPDKGWGTPEKPTKATFPTQWYVSDTRCLVDYSSTFNFTKTHFHMIEVWNKYLSTRKLIP